MKIKKKKIRIPKALTGLELNGEIAENANIGGLGTAGNIASALPLAALLITQPLEKSTSNTGSDAVKSSLKGIASGAAAGAALGSVIPGVGTAVGAIAGAAVGLVGNSGEKAKMTSFTDYDEGSLGTGLIGAFTNRKLRRERERIKRNVYNNRAAVQGTEYLANEYAMDYGDMNTNTFAVGGVSPSSLVYADDGELIKTPDGNISKIPEQGKPTDSNLLNLPEGSRILSDTLKVPGTKDTFAKAGEKIMKKKSRSKYTDRYAENSLMLNDMNNQIAYDNLFELQELVKAEKGIKPKTKQLITAAEDGEEVGSNKPTGWNYPISNYTYIGMGRYSNPDMAQYMSNREWLLNNLNSPLTQTLLADINSGKYGSIGNNYLNFELFPTLSMDGKYGPVHNAVAQFNRLSNTGNLSNGTARNNPNTSFDPDKELANTWQNLLDAMTLDPNSVTLPYDPKFRPRKPKTRRKVNWGNLADGLSSVAELAPALSNIFTSSPKNIEANYNPYSNAILNAARGRRYNIDPLMQDINRNRAISNYNASLLNTSTGAGMAFRLANAVNSNDAISSARAQESNVNNQYLMDYANIANNLGQQWVSASNLAEDLNRQSFANARNIRRQGLSQLSQWSQNNRLMRNQTRRDNALLQLYKPFLESAYTNDVLSNYAKWIKKGGNSWQ